MRPHAADTDADTGRDLVRPLLRRLPDVIFRLSRDGIFLEHIPTDGRRVGAFADPIIGLPVEHALPAAQADETTRALERALQSGEMQRLDYVAWEEDERHVIEGRVVATGDRDALLMLLDATEQRALAAASEAIVEASHALVANEPFGAICENIVEILARRLEYALARIEIRHPDLPGTNVVALHGDASSYDEALGRASLAVGDSEGAAVVGAAASVPIIDGDGVLGSISVAGDRPRRPHPAVVHTLESVAASLVNVRNSERAATALAYQARTLRVYEDTGRLLAATLDLDEILDALAREIVEAGVFRSLMVALVDERAEVVRVVRNLSREIDGSVGDGGRGVIGTTYRLDDDNITPQVARTGELSVLRGWDDRYDPRFSDPEAYSRRRVAYFIPVKKGDRVLAVLATGSQADEEAETLQRIEDMSGLLAQVAVALDHAMLYRETQLAREEMRAVMAGARCLLWHATVEAGEPEEDGGRRLLSWDTRAFDAEAAQRFMQLDVADGETYEAAWYASKVADDVQPMYDAAADALFGGASGYSQEYRCVDARGATRWLFEDVHIESAGPGRWSLIGVCTDVTARKRVERMKDEFISTVSHELRTPLTSILGALELVVGGSAGELPEQSVPLLKIARDNGRRLTRLVNDILDIDRIESGRVAFDMQAMELAPLIDAAMEANRPFATGLDVELAFEGAIPGIEVDVDAGRFAQLMTNLLSNASKFSPPHDKVTVTMQERDGWVRVSVADNGPGIPESARDDLFERFTQVDSSTTRQHAGTGLGLAIAKMIVERLRGRIDLVSEVDVGTTFFFDLQIRARPTPDESDPTVVVCARDDSAAHALADALDADDRVVEIAADVDALVQSADDEAPDVVVVDMALVAPGPRALLARLRATPALRATAVVVARFSAADTPDGPHARGLHVLDYLPRPLDGERLLNLVVEASSRGGASAPLILHVGADAELARETDRALADVGGVAHASDTRRARDLLRQHDVDVALIDLAAVDDVSDALDAVDATPVVLLGPAADGTTPERLPELPTREDGPGALVALVDSVLAEWRASD